MKIAIEGCAHGEMDKIYEVIGRLEEQNNMKVDLLIICGDFQSVRNQADLNCMAVPQNFKKMNTFYKYYSGEKVAPVLTLFVGGNHEASNYLQELHYGGWVCPNIFYLGCAGVVQFGGIRIAGLSGIYKGHDYWKGHYECAPYNKNTMRSVYHIRKLETHKLSQVKEPLDIIVSHDWPRGIYDFGNTNNLFKRKPFFRDEIEKGVLGSPPGEELLKALRPQYWFAAHLHCKYAALVPHEDGSVTKFLALDKCLPRRKFLQILDIENKPDCPLVLAYDLEWLSILQKTDRLLNVTSSITVFPVLIDDNSSPFQATEEDKNEVARLLIERKLSTPTHMDTKIGETATGSNETTDADVITESSVKSTVYPISTEFERTVPAYVEGSRAQDTQISTCTNNQTTNLCGALGLTDPLQRLLNSQSGNLSISDFIGSSVDYSDTVATTDCSMQDSFNPDEIDLDSGGDEVENSSASKSKIDDLNATFVDGSPLFVIDTKPNFRSTPFGRLAMKLPPPSATVSQENLTEVEKPPASKRLSTDEPQLDSGCVEINVTPAKPKTFKRRNVAMYASKKDSDEDI